MLRARRPFPQLLSKALLALALIVSASLHGGARHENHAPALSAYAMPGGVLPDLCLTGEHGAQDDEAAGWPCLLCVLAGSAAPPAAPAAPGPRTARARRRALPPVRAGPGWPRAGFRAVRPRDPPSPIPTV